MAVLRGHRARGTGHRADRPTLCAVLCALCAVLCALCLVGCGPTWVQVPTAATPYDAQIWDLNARICAERGLVYDGSTCVEPATSPSTGSGPRDEPSGGVEGVPR